MEMVYEIQNASVADRPKFKSKVGVKDCIFEPLQKWLNNASQQLKPYDTIYVQLPNVEHFVNFTLPQVRVPIVIISNDFSSSPNLDPIADILLSNEYVMRWFLTNIGNTVPNYTHHDKVSPWPFGLAENTFRAILNHNVHLYSKVFHRTPPPPAEKRNGIFLSFLGPTNEARQSIPRGRRYEPRPFFGRLSSARFVFSPDGDRPDCFRHYEAIGLGVIPVTQLDPWMYRHLAGGPVIFQNSNWNVSFWNTSTALADHNISVANRNLVFEEYWMEYAEREVGRPLMWWDHHQTAPTTLEGIFVSLQA